MNYSEKIVTNIELKENVLCFWQMNGFIPRLESINSRYIPKGQSFLIFNYGNKIKLSNMIIDSPFFVVPTITSSIILNQTGNINLFGVSFIGDGLYKLLNQPLTKINQKIPKQLSDKCEKVYEEIRKNVLHNKYEIIESFLLDNLILNIENQTLKRAIQLINKHKGILKIVELSEQLNISERQLQRLFKTRLGLSPKNYCKIIRINNYIEFIFKKEEGVIDWMELVVKFNYHDQSHLINEVKTISKLSPKKLLKYRDTLSHRYEHN